MAQSTIVISCDVGETRVALIEHGILAEIYVERERDRSPVGNIYLGKVTRVLPGMQAAFVDIGLDRAAFLHVEDVIPQEDFDKLVGDKDAGDDEEADETKEGRKDDRDSSRLSRKTPIRDVLKEPAALARLQEIAKAQGASTAQVIRHVVIPGSMPMIFTGLRLSLQASWTTLVAAELVLLLWIREAFALSWLQAAAAVAAIDVVLAGLSLRIGGQMLKGPYLPQTTAGLIRTTRAITGKS
jgi:hypothetical protein